MLDVQFRAQLELSPSQSHWSTGFACAIARKSRRRAGWWAGWVDALGVGWEIVLLSLGEGTISLGISLCAIFIHKTCCFQLLTMTRWICSRTLKLPYVFPPSSFHSSGNLLILLAVKHSHHRRKVHNGQTTSRLSRPRRR